MLGPSKKRLAFSSSVLWLWIAAAQGAIRESVEVYPSSGNEVRVECFAPRTKGVYPVILLLHGSGGLEEATGDAFRSVARRMAGKGAFVMVPHLHDAGRDQFTWAKSVQDALEFADSTGLADVKRIGILGFSMGATSAFLQGARDQRVKAIVSLSGSLPIGSRSKFPPTLLIHGAEDDSTPIPYLRKFEQALKEKKTPCIVHIYEGQEHNLDLDHFDDAGKRALAFFITYLEKPIDPATPVDKTKGEPDSKARDSSLPASSPGSNR